MVEVRNNGVPLIEAAPKAAITQSILALTDPFSGRATAEEIAEEAAKAAPNRRAGRICSARRNRSCQGGESLRRPASIVSLGRRGQGIPPRLPVGQRHFCLIFAQTVSYGC